MKINPIGIQSYQQTVRRDAPEQKEVGADPNVQQANKLNIEPHNKATRSQMAVKAPQGSYDEFLSVEEKRALELLFSRFRNAAAGSAENGEQQPGLGSWVDVKA